MYLIRRFVFFVTFAAEPQNARIMEQERRIPEAEYAADLAQGLDELSGAIRKSGLSIAAIARGTRCHWETVYHAANGVPVRFDSARRIMYYLKTIEQ